jgi:Skp family chaperone for outer membrane proteins
MRLDFALVRYGLLHFLLTVACRNFAHTQDLKFCMADMHSIATQTGMMAHRDQLLDAQAQRVSARLHTRRPLIHYRPPQFSKDNDRLKRFTDELARLEAEYLQQEENAAAELEKYAEKIADSLFNDIYSQIELFTNSRGCAVVIDRKSMLYGGEEITNAVTQQILENASICARWHLLKEP